MGAYSWVMTGDRNASTEMISASEHGFAEGLSEESYIDYWSEIFYQNDLSITFGGYADYAFWSGAGISVEGEFSVLNGWGLNINFDANLGYGASAGGYVGASIAAPSISTPGDLSISSGFDIKGPVGGSVSLGGGRLGGSVSIGVGVFYGVTLTTPLY